MPGGTTARRSSTSRSTRCVSAIRSAVDVPISITTQRQRQTSLGTITALFEVLPSCPDLATVNVAPLAPDLPAHREEARQILEACEPPAWRRSRSSPTLEAPGRYRGPVRGWPARPGAVAAFRAGRAPGRGRARPRRDAAEPVAPRRGARRQRGQARAGSRTGSARRRPPSAPRRPRSAAGSGSDSRTARCCPTAPWPRSNAELVELAVALADALGREPVEPADARRLLRRGEGERRGRRIARADDRRGRQARHAPPRDRPRRRPAGARGDPARPRRRAREGRRARGLPGGCDRGRQAHPRPPAAVPSDRPEPRRVRHRDRRASWSCSRRPARRPRRPASRWRR